MRGRQRGEGRAGQRSRGSGGSKERAGLGMAAVASWRAGSGWHRALASA